MKIVHTADWHLGDRLGRIDRTEDLRRAVERVARHCDEQRAEVLLIAGDLFSEMSRPDGLRESIRHLQETFRPFLLGGGTILAITGNHDNESFCQTLRLVMDLAAPASSREGELVAPGRLYLATEPTFQRLAGRGGETVQFVLMPYPTPARYLRDAEAQRYGSLEEKNQKLRTAFTHKLAEILQQPAYDRALPTVLAAHVHVYGATLPSLFRISEQESIVFDDADLMGSFAYVALGHIHRAQALRGLEHVRYCGSIERLDLGEQGDAKSVALIDIGTGGLREPPVTLPLQARPVYAVEIREPKTEIPALAERYADADEALVNLQVTYTAGVDNLESVLRQLDEVFPNWYARSWSESGELRQPLTSEEPGRHKSFEDTVRDYLRQELTNHAEGVREAVLTRAEALLTELQGQ